MGSSCGLSPLNVLRSITLTRRLDRPNCFSAAPEKQSEISLHQNKKLHTKQISVVTSFLAEMCPSLTPRHYHRPRHLEVVIKDEGSRDRGAQPFTRYSNNKQIKRADPALISRPGQLRHSGGDVKSLSWRCSSAGPSIRGSTFFSVVESNGRLILYFDRLPVRHLCPERCTEKLRLIVTNSVYSV